MTLRPSFYFTDVLRSDIDFSQYTFKARKPMQRPLPMRRFALIFPYARKKRKGLASAEHALARSLRP
jgi:hypothetical protein